MKVCAAGAYGSFRIKHLDAISAIDELEISSIMGRNGDKIQALASDGHTGLDRIERSLS